MKLFAALLVLTIPCSQIITNEAVETSNILEPISEIRSFKQPYLSYHTYSEGAELYTFEIGFEATDETVYFGKAFIAENQIWTARHLAEEGFDFMNDLDLHLLGTSSIRGLVISKEEVKEGDVLYYYPAGEDRRFMYVSEIGDTHAYVIISENFRMGDSGSPVLNEKTNEVVGIISGTTYEVGKCFIALMSQYDKDTANDKEESRDSARGNQQDDD